MAARPSRPPHPSTTARTVLAAAVAVAVILSLSGCTGSGGRGHDGGSRTGAAPPGDTRSAKPTGPTTAVKATKAQLLAADPCGFVDTAALARFGTVSVEPDQTFDSCSASIDGPGDDVVSVSAQLQVGLSGSSPGGPAQRPDTVDGVTVYAEPGDTSLCSRDVVAAEGAVVSVYASEDKAPRDDPCRVSTALTKAVVRQVREGTITPAGYPSGSLARQDACHLLEPADATKVPGVDGKVHPSFAGHACTWGNESITEPSVLVSLRRGGQPAPDNASGSATTVLGHKAVVQPHVRDENVNVVGPSLPTCDATVMYQPLTPAHKNWVETVEVVVSADRDPAESLCPLATQLVTSALRRLPPT